MIFETRKILGLDDLAVCATCVRVPVFVGHAMSINAEFEKPIELQDAEKLLSRAEGVVFHGDPNEFPVAADAAGNDNVHIGRLRVDPSVDNGLVFWAVADNLRKGAATNAVQIAEVLRELGRLH